MPTDYDYIASEHRLDYGRKLTLWAQDHLANRYSDRTHFIFELLQNAEDALAEREERSLPTSVTFNLKPNGLEVRHFGKPFTPANVKSICAINESTKKGELTEIGRFGIGFKSVYAFTQRPEVHSGDEHFAIEDFVLPVGVLPRETKPDETLFWIPFVDGDADAISEVSQALRTLGSRKLLFLKAVTEISWSLPDGSGGVFLKNSPVISDEGTFVTLLGEVDGELMGVEENWLLFSRRVVNNEGEHAGFVELAFMLDRNSDGSSSVKEVSDSNLVVFFPTEVRTGFGFLLQGPYRTTPSRDNVPPNDAWNRQLVEESAALLIDSLKALRKKEMLGVEALRILPIDVRLYPQESMFRPIFTRVRDALKDQPFLPAFQGGHIAGVQSRLARSEALRELISPSQLADLLGSDLELNWLSDEITRDRAFTLREFLRQQVGVEEIIPDSLSSLLTQGFLEKQSDEWISKFYEFLSGQKALVRDLLRKQIPLIRTESGTHVVPKLNEQPQAFLPGLERTGFLTVKREVCKAPTVIEFLRSIGLSEPDPVDDVVQNVLVNYHQPTSPSEIDYESDVRRILAAFSTDSDQSRRKLIEALRRAFFLRAIEAENGEVRFLKPAQVYRSTQRVKTVFNGVKGVWLVDDRLAVLRGEPMRDLLQACGALDVFRTFSSETELSSDEKELLRLKRGNDVFTWDDISDDSDSSDVAAFLITFQNLSPDEATNRSIEFWLLLRETLRDRREAYFQARYVWGFGQRTWSSSFPATWVRRLRDASWIPTKEGLLKRPDETCFSDVHEEIRHTPSPFLTEILGFRPEAIKELAEKEGIDLEALTLLKRHNISATQLLELLGESQTDGLVNGTTLTEHEQSIEETTNEPQQREEELQDVRGRDGSSGTTKPSVYGPYYSSGGGSTNQKSQSAPRDQFHTYVGVHTPTSDDNENLSEDERRRIEMAAITYILEVEPTLQAAPMNHPGFDLFEGEALEFPVRFVEVKSKKSAWQGPVALSDEQFRLAESEEERYWLYVVEFAEDPDKRHIHRIQDPAGKARYFTYDSGWKTLAE